MGSSAHGAWMALIAAQKGPYTQWVEVMSLDRSRCMIGITKRVTFWITRTRTGCEVIQVAEFVVSLPFKPDGPRGSKTTCRTSSLDNRNNMPTDIRLKVAIVGTGISGLSAAWLLSQRHDVTVYERADRVGGHSNTIVASVGGHRHSRRHRLHCLQPANLSQPDRLVRTAKGSDPVIGNVVWRFNGRWRARILRGAACRVSLDSPEI